MARPAQPGLHDPIWYELTFAQCQIVEMLDPNSDIDSVTIQAPKVRGIDDVVVTKRDGSAAYYQLKHSRVGGSISLPNFARAEPGEPTLLRQLAEGWAEQTRKGRRCETHLITNRRPSSRQSRTADGVHWPPLAAFWKWLSSAVAGATTTGSVAPPAEWAGAWRLWQAELAALSDGEQLLFLKTLHLELGGDDTVGLEAAIRARLAGLFGIPAETASRALAQLDHELRKWATSRRGDDVAVTAEKACAAFAAGGSEAIGDHALSPPAPFFGTRDAFVSILAARIRARRKGIVFLTGPAGCGKSSVVSALANRADPLVDLRFHAFRPLTPQSKSIPEDVGRSVTAVALWGDLLVQLRAQFFQRRLWEHKVPVRNDFLLENPDVMRAHVMRLASLLAKERGRPTVIAIDGVDHAARARHLTPEVLAGRLSLLSSLVPPDEVDEGVVFLIAGQPGWQGYPAWLRTPDPNVETIEVPEISVADIEALVREAPGPLPPLEAGAAARIIAKFTRGNTLASVYAALEARAAPDLLHLEAHLESRRLGGGIEAYYSALWEGALSGTTSAKPAIETQLATALALSSARLTGDLLAAFYPRSGYAAADWEAVLRKLEPIVEGGPSGYAIRHNDLRVFLMTRLGADRRLPVESAGAIADYYLTAGPSAARHADLFRALEFAERTRELPAAFSPEYVAEAVALRRPVPELEEQARLALTAAGRMTDWAHVHTLALGLATFRQARSVADYYQLDSSMPLPAPPCAVSEAKVLPRDEWTAERIDNVLSDAEALVASGELARATAMCDRWFAPLHPLELANHLSALEPTDESRSHEGHDRVENLLRRFGALARSLSLKPVLRRDSEEETERAREFEASFVGGWLKASLASTQPWDEALRAASVWFPIDVETCLAQLAVAARWSELVGSLVLLKTARPRLSVGFRVRAAAWAIEAAAPQDLIQEWVQPIAHKGFDLLADYRGSVNDDELGTYVSMALVIGYTHSGRPSGGVSADGLLQYFSHHSDERLRERVGQLLYAAAWTGLYLRRDRSRSADEPSLTLALELATVARSLLLQDFSRSAPVPPGYMQHAAHIVDLILDRVTPADAHLESELSDLLLEYASETQVGPALEIVWEALARRGHLEALRGWMQAWIGPEGRVWHLDLGERSEIAKRFAALGRKQGWEDEVANAEERLLWNQLGYTGHKEYALSQPLEAFTAAARGEPHLWENLGLRLFAISEEASAAGGNRLRWDVDRAVAGAAARVGPSALWRLARTVAAARGRPFALGDDFIFDGLIDALEYLAVTQADALSLWCVGVGALPWERDRNQVLLADLRRALTLRVVRCGCAGATEDMRSLAAFEWSLGPEEGEDSRRWFAPESELEEGTSRKDLLKGLRERSVDEAIRIIVGGARASISEHPSDFWRAIAECGRRLCRERTAAYVESLQLLRSALLLRTGPYSWSFDGFADAVEAIVPLLQDSEVLEFCGWTVDQAMKNGALDISLPAASENLRVLVSLPSGNRTHSGRREHLERELRMHECWILGGRPERAGRTLPVIPVVSDGPFAPSSWCDFALGGLLELLKSTSAVRSRGAARGLYALLSSQDKANESGALLWDSFHWRQRRLVLLALERLASEHPDAFVRWQSVVERCLQEGEGEEQVQALVTLESFSRASGPARPWELPPLEPHAHGALVRRVGRLLDVPGDYRGLVGLGSRHSVARQVARMFAEATRQDQTEIESLVAAHLRDELTVDLQPDQETFWDGDMRLSSATDVDEAIRLLVNETRAGCLGRVSPSAMAQAVLRSDEPRVFTTSGVVGEKAGEWPVDDELEHVVAAGTRAVEERLRLVAEAGLGGKERLLGAHVTTYSRKNDVALTMLLGWAYDPLDPVAQLVPRTFTGRGFIAYSDDGFEPPQRKEAGWFTLPAVGPGAFIHGSVPLASSRIWRAFGWSPSPENPYVWLRDDSVVARLEVVRGPVRRLIRDLLHRQPVMFRWVADSEAVEAAARWLASPLRECFDVETAAVRE